MARLAALIASGPTPTRSRLEDRFVRLLQDESLPRPLINSRLHGLEVDFLFAAERLVVETDGGRFHGTEIARRRDAARDAALHRAGYRVLRFTWDEVTRDPGRTTARIRQALAG